MLRKTPVLARLRRRLTGSWRIGLSAFAAFLGSDRSNAHSTNIFVRLDRTPQDGSSLAMSGPAADDDADTSRNPRALVRYLPRHGKPHADAGAIGLGLPRPNEV